MKDNKCECSGGFGSENEAKITECGNHGKQKVVYVAGKYTSDTEWGIWNNIEHASRVARSLWEQGYAVICPHKNTAFFGGAGHSHRQLWLEGDLEIIRRCDVMYMLNNWKDSEGAKEELALAIQLGLEIQYEPLED